MAENLQVIEMRNHPERQDSDIAAAEDQRFGSGNSNRNRSVLLLLLYFGISGCLAAAMSVPNAALRKSLGEKFYGRSGRSRYETILEVIHASVGTASALCLARCITDPRRRLIVAQIGLTCSTLWTACQYSVWLPHTDWLAYAPYIVCNCFGSVFLAETSVHEIIRGLHRGDIKNLYITQTWIKAVKLLTVAGTNALLSFTPDAWHPQITAAVAIGAIILLTALVCESLILVEVAREHEVDDFERHEVSNVRSESSAWYELIASTLAIAAVGLFMGQRAEYKFTYYMNKDVLDFTDGQIRLIAGVQYLLFSSCLYFSSFIQRIRPNSTNALLAVGILTSVVSRLFNAAIHGHDDDNIDSKRTLFYISLMFSCFGPIPEPILRTEALWGCRLSGIKYISLAIVLVDRGSILVLNPIYYALTFHYDANPYYLTVGLLSLAYICNRAARLPNSYFVNYILYSRKLSKKL